MPDNKASADTTGATRLTNLNVKEVSVVDLGANKRPFAVMKNLEGDAMALSKAEKEKAAAEKVEAEKVEAEKKAKAEGVAKAKAEADKKAEAEVVAKAKADADAFPPGDGAGTGDTVAIDKSIEAVLPILRDAVSKSNPELAEHLGKVVAQLTKRDISDEEAAKVLGVDLEDVAKAKRMTGGRMAQLTKLADGLGALSTEFATFAKQFGKEEDEHKTDDVKKSTEPEATASGDSVQTDILKAMMESNAIMAKRLEILETTQPAARGQGPTSVVVEKSEAQKEADVWNGVGGTRRN